MFDSGLWAPFWVPLGSSGAPTWPHAAPEGSRIRYDSCFDDLSTNFGFIWYHIHGCWAPVWAALGSSGVPACPHDAPSRDSYQIRIRKQPFWETPGPNMPSGTKHMPLGTTHMPFGKS